MNFCVETEREDDGRWIAEVTDIPGVMAYGQTEEEALSHVYAIAMRVIADQIEEQNQATKPMVISFLETC